MTPSKDFNLHSLAKKAKHRLIGKLDNSQVAYVSKSANQRCEYYCKVVKMLTSTEKVYDPIARLIGKDLSTIPNSSEKQRLAKNSTTYATNSNPTLPRHTENTVSLS